MRVSLKYTIADSVVVVVPVMAVLMAGGGWWWWCGCGAAEGLLNTIEFNMAVQWWQHGVCVVYTKQTFSQKQINDESIRVSPPRLVAKQTCRNSALSFVIWEESISMMIGLAGGWMEWSGAGKGRAGDGDGDGEGEWRGGRGGEGYNRSILDCSNMMTVLCV